jgi:hypothetical protein
MTDHDHGTVQVALLAIAQTREAWPYLEAAKDASLARHRPQPRPLTAAARAELDRILRAEKAERVANQRAGLIPRLAGFEPARLAVIDAGQLAARTITDLVWLATEQLGDFNSRDPDIRRALALDGFPIRPPILAGVHPQLDYLADVIALDDENLLDAAFITAAAVELATSAAMLRNVLHLDESWIPVARRCPCCQRRSIRAYLGSPNVREWTIVCRGDRPACLCEGRNCPCQRPGRRPGTRHVWSAALLRHFGRIAPRTDAA